MDKDNRVKIRVVKEQMALTKMALKPDYNMVSLLMVIFHQGINEDNQVCQEFSHFLLARARSRGYAGEFELAFDQCESARDMVTLTADLCSYVCINDFREMYVQRSGSAYSRN